MLIDVTLCVGCGACQAACQAENELDGGDNITGLTGDVWTYVDSAEITKAADGTDLSEPDSRFVRRQCFHCQNPACASVCPVGALKKTDVGPVIYQEGRCMGCRYCMVACPFDVPRYQWNKALPAVGKCQLCYKRLSQGQPTACSEVCPTGATLFGTREELLAEAHRRIAAEPGKYVNHVYGETEVGGTSVLILSDVPFEQLAMKTNVSDSALPELTWKVVSKVPAVAGGMAAFLTAAYFATHWKDTEKKEEER
jgi:formate dehydrogenase iron-sulfur subunit